MRTVGELLESYLKEENLNKRQFALAAGVEPMVLTRAIRHSKNPTDENFKKILSTVKWKGEKRKVFVKAHKAGKDRIIAKKRGLGREQMKLAAIQNVHQLYDLNVMPWAHVDVMHKQDGRYYQGILDFEQHSEDFDKELASLTCYEMDIIDSNNWREERHGLKFEEDQVMAHANCHILLEPKNKKNEILCLDWSFVEWTPFPEGEKGEELQNWSEWVRILDNKSEVPSTIIFRTKNAEQAWNEVTHDYHKEECPEIMRAITKSIKVPFHGVYHAIIEALDIEIQSRSPTKQIEGVEVSKEIFMKMERHFDNLKSHLFAKKPDVPKAIKEYLFAKREVDSLRSEVIRREMELSILKQVRSYFLAQL